MKALLLGSTGLVGSFCITELLADSRIESLLLPVRRLPEVPCNDPRVSYVQVNFERLADYAEHFRCDVVFCCLGTTIGKAGSRAAFEKIDVTLPLLCAALAFRQGARAFGLVSAMGANTHSWLFYNRCKGMLEKGLQLIGFASLTIVRPALLMGDRQEKRNAELFAQRLSSRIAPWIPAFWRPVGAWQVARALVMQTLAQESGTRILYNRTLVQV